MIGDEFQRLVCRGGKQGWWWLFFFFFNPYSHTFVCL